MAETTPQVPAAKKSVYKYADWAAAKWPDAVTQVPVRDLTRLPAPNDPFATVALGSKEVVGELTPRPNRPGGTVKVRPATQPELQYLFEVLKHPHITKEEQ